MLIGDSHTQQLFFLYLTVFRSLLRELSPSEEHDGLEMAQNKFQAKFRVHKIGILLLLRMYPNDSTSPAKGCTFSHRHRHQPTSNFIISQES